MSTSALPPGGLGLPWSAPLAGRLDEHAFASDALAANPLADPPVRPLWVYVLQGFTGHLAMWRNRAAFRQPFPETADAAVASGACPPVIVVYVDAWTALGGSQFVDSPGTTSSHR